MHSRSNVMRRVKARYIKGRRSLSPALIGAIVAVVVLITAAWADLSAGTKAPDFKLPNIKGGQFQLSDCFKGDKPKVVVLDLWATWCPPCRGEIPYLIKLKKAYANKDVQITGVALDKGLDTVKTFARENKINYTVCHDPNGDKLGKPYDIQGIPATYVIDKTGKIRFAHSGFPRDAQGQKDEYDKFKQQIDQLLAE
jgi:peroxiredoxin